MTAYKTGMPGSDALTLRLDRLAQEALAHNKVALFEFLGRSSVHTVTVEFDGYGDDGQIRSVDAFDAGNGALDLPDGSIEVQAPLPDGSGLTTENVTVREVLEAMAYDFLERTHSGWEDGEGAFGTFTFSVADGRSRSSTTCGSSRPNSSSIRSEEDRCGTPLPSRSVFRP